MAAAIDALVPISKISSVASFFLTRIDGKIDRINVEKRQPSADPST